MATLESIYEQLQNPLDSDKTLGKIIECYFNTDESDREKDFYHELVNINGIKYRGNISEHVEYMDSLLFNVWKKCM